MPIGGPGPSRSAINALPRPVVAQLSRLGAEFSTGAPSRFKATIDGPASDQAVIRAAIVENICKAVLHPRGLRTRAVASHADILHREFDIMGYSPVGHIAERVMTSLGSLADICTFIWTRTELPESDPALHSSS